jgi:hypothetical protein
MQGEHFMRTWIKDGARVLMTGAALATVGAVMAYSGVSTDRYTLPGDRDERQHAAAPGAQMPDSTQAGDSEMTTGLPGTSALTRPRMAGAAGVALAVLGVSMMIRRRRRAAGPGEDI